MNNIEEQCYALWKEVFGDSDSFIKHFMSRYYREENLLYIEREGILQSMLHLVPFEHDGKTIGIIYALATREASRSKGYATQLIRQAIDTAKERAYSATALIPAEESLFGYYNKQGFINRYRVSFVLPDNFDFGIDDKEKQWLTIIPLTNEPTPETESTITLTFIETQNNI